jgi:quercetin dioxygenase-like cupin family protein
MDKPLPSFVVNGLPMIQSPLQGVNGYLLQGAEIQGLFFSVEAGVFFPEHSHEAQWGVVIEGEFDITVDGETTTYKKGDTYYIPEGVIHTGHYRTDVISFDVFNSKDKFKSK